MIFKIYDCDFGITVRGVNYDFTDIDSVVIDDPQTVELTRGANAGNSEGLIFTQGSKEAKTVTLVLPSIPMALLTLLTDVFEKKERVEAYCISRSDGSSRMIKKAIINQKPQQLTIDESEDSINISLMLKSFSVTDKHKS